MATSRQCCNLTKPARRPKLRNRRDILYIFNYAVFFPAAEHFLLVEWDEGTHSIVNKKDVDGDASSLKKGDVARVKVRKDWYPATILGSGMAVYVYTCIIRVYVYIYMYMQ